MRNGYNPVQDCLQAPADPKDVYRKLWIAVAVELILELAEAYSLLKDGSGDSSGTLLNSVNQKIDQLNQRLDAVTAELNNIIDLLKDLPNVIRGVIDAENIKQLYGEVAGRCSIIKDASASPAIIAQQPDRLQESLDDVVQLLGGAAALQGAAGMLASAPFATTWLLGAVAFQKVMREQNPNWIIVNPWKTDFWVNKVSVPFTDFFAQVESTDNEYESAIKSMPPHGEPLILQGFTFIPAPIFPNGTTYRWTCPTGVNGQKLQLQQAGGGWVDVQPNDPNQVAALYAYDLLMNLQLDIVSFYNVIPALYAKKQDILGGLAQPPGYFGN